MLRNTLCQMWLLRRLPLLGLLLLLNWNRLGFGVMVYRLTGDLHGHETTGYGPSIDCSEMNSGRMRHIEIGRILRHDLQWRNLLQRLLSCKLSCLIE